MDITVTSPHLQSKIDIMRRQIHSLGTLKRQTSKEERYKTYCAGKFPSHSPIRPKLWDTTPTHSSWSKRFYSDLIQRHIGLYTTYLTRPAVRCVVDYLFGDKSPNAGRNRGVTSVGCGHGYLEAMLTQHVDEVVAIDVHNYHSSMMNVRKFEDAIMLHDDGCGTPLTFAATGTTTVNGLNPEMKEVISDMDYFVWEENTAIWTKGRSKISSDIGQKGPLHTVLLVHTAEGNVIVVDWSYRQFLAAELKNVRLYHGSFR